MGTLARLVPFAASVYMVTADPLVSRHSPRALQVIVANPAVGAHGSGSARPVPVASHLEPSHSHGPRALEVVPSAPLFEPTCLHGARSGEIVPGSANLQPARLHPARAIEVIPGAIYELPSVACVGAVVMPVPPSPSGLLPNTRRLCRCRFRRCRGRARATDSTATPRRASGR